MPRWTRIALVLVAAFALLAPGAHAASPFAKATVVSCDREAREAVFAGRVLIVRRAVRMQMRFTLQATTPDEPRWRKVDAPGFGEWITAPAGYGKYTYDKTVQELLAPASYRAVVNFRWRDAGGRIVRSERAVSGVCRQPDSRPDLVVRDVHADRDGLVAVVRNRGRQPAGGFDVDFLRDGEAVGTVRVVALEPHATVDVFLPGARCAPGQRLEAIVDPRSEVDEADEENDTLSVSC
jgi:hypothetical protein